MLTLPAEGLIVPTNGDEQDDGVGAERREREAGRGHQAGRHHQQRSLIDPRPRGSPMPSVISAEPSSASVATTPTSKAPSPSAVR